MNWIEGENEIERATQGCWVARSLVTWLPLSVVLRLAGQKRPAGKQKWFATGGSFYGPKLGAIENRWVSRRGSFPMSDVRKADLTSAPPPPLLKLGIKRRSAHASRVHSDKSPARTTCHLHRHGNRARVESFCAECQLELATDFASDFVHPPGQDMSKYSIVLLLLIAAVAQELTVTAAQDLRKY